MFIETLEFTIPVDMCDLFSTMKKRPNSNLEFPASVNSYGTTQDASIQVVLKSNKLTFKVDGVSSNASMISKSECKTLKLSVFDVDCRSTISEQEDVSYNNSHYDSYSDVPTHSTPFINPAKRSHESPIRPRSPKHRRTSETVSNSNSAGVAHPQPNSSDSKADIDLVNIKEEPDLVEIDPAEFDEIERTKRNSEAEERVSFPHASSSFNQNVSHSRFSQPGTSQYGDQGEDGFMNVYPDQGSNDYEDDNDNGADYGNDGYGDGAFRELSCYDPSKFRHFQLDKKKRGNYTCPICGKIFSNQSAGLNHKEAEHDGKTYMCICGKEYKYRTGLRRHKEACSVFISTQNQC